MKTFLVLLMSSFLSVAAFAADRSPAVTINGNGRHEVEIDGRRFTQNNNVRLTDLNRGTHYVRVYELRRGLFGQSRKLVAQSSFYLNNSDVYVSIDRAGSINIQDRNNRGVYDRRDDRYGRNDDRYDRGYHKNSKKFKKQKKYNRGKSYGHHKNGRDWDRD